MKKKAAAFQLLLLAASRALGGAVDYSSVQNNRCDLPFLDDGSGQVLVLNDFADGHAAERVRVDILEPRPGYVAIQGKSTLVRIRATYSSNYSLMDKMLICVDIADRFKSVYSDCIASGDARIASASPDKLDIKFDISISGSSFFSITASVVGRVSQLAVAASSVNFETSDMPTSSSDACDALSEFAFLDRVLNANFPLSQTCHCKTELCKHLLFAAAHAPAVSQSKTGVEFAHTKRRLDVLTSASESMDRGDFDGMLERHIQSSPVRYGVHIIIFSRDRPLELDALLASIVHFVESSASIRTTVVYSMSAPFREACGEDGYALVRERFPDVEFLDEDKDGGFSSTLMRTLQKSTATHIVPIVSEVVFIRKINLLNLAITLSAVSPRSTLNLRLGTQLDLYRDMQALYGEQFTYHSGGENVCDSSEQGIGLWDRRSQHKMHVSVALRS